MSEEQRTPRVLSDEHRAKISEGVKKARVKRQYTQRRTAAEQRALDRGAGNITLPRETDDA